MLGDYIQTRHIHSSLFLASRVLFACALVPQWRSLRVTVASILFLCAAHQSALYIRRGKRIDERKLYQRTSIRRLHQSTGPIGKLLAALQVYFWEFSSRPHPLNLAHWLEVAVFTSFVVEYVKISCASRWRLHFFWDSKDMALEMKGIERDATDLARSQVFITASEIFRWLLRVKRSDCSRLVALPKAPSFIVFLLWLGFGRKALSILQGDPRGRAYHMNAFFTNYVRLRGIETKRSVRPTAFGVDMAPYFNLGISRKIAVRELEEPELRERLRKELMKHKPEMSYDETEIQEPIDYESVYCISYRHLEDRKREGSCLLLTCSLAAHLAKARGYLYFRVWMDKILRQRPGKESESWAFYGLLPYAYFPVVAVRNTTEDEDERMWLLAEEKLAYGNMGLGIICEGSDPLSFELKHGLRLGPEGSMLVYLRYLKTEESASERTFHLEDKQRFKGLADRHGTTDDEQDMYEGLFLNTELKPMPPGYEHFQRWFVSILDVESYAALRKREVAVDRIEFEKVENVEFDGYREWFLWKDERLKPSIRPEHENKIKTSLLAQARFLTAYHCRSKEYSIIVLIYRGHSGYIRDRAACICLNYENQDDNFRVLQCIRIRLRYDKSPDDGAYLYVAEQLIRSNEDEDVQVVRLDPKTLSFL